MCKNNLGKYACKMGLRIQEWGPIRRVVWSHYLLSAFFCHFNNASVPFCTNQEYFAFRHREPIVIILSLLTVDSINEAARLYTCKVNLHRKFIITKRRFQILLWHTLHLHDNNWDKYSFIIWINCTQIKFCNRKYERWKLQSRLSFTINIEQVRKPLWDTNAPIHLT